MRGEFNKEADLQQSLGRMHPCILPVVARSSGKCPAGKPEKIKYLDFEALAGDANSDAAAPAAASLSFAAQLLLAVEYIHFADSDADPPKFPVIHRDLKLENVLLRSESEIRELGDVLLADFGCAQSLTKRHSKPVLACWIKRALPGPKKVVNAVQGGTGGTDGHRAPEDQAGLDGGNCTKMRVDGIAADMYCVGKVLAEACSRQPEQPVWLEKIRPHLTARDPERRWTALQVLQNEDAIRDTAVALLQAPHGMEEPMTSVVSAQLERIVSASRYAWPGSPKSDEEGAVANYESPYSPESVEIASVSADDDAKAPFADAAAGACAAAAQVNLEESPPGSPTSRLPHATNTRNAPALMFRRGTASPGRQERVAAAGALQDLSTSWARGALSTPFLPPRDTVSRTDIMDSDRSNAGVAACAAACVAAPPIRASTPEPRREEVELAVLSPALPGTSRDQSRVSEEFENETRRGLGDIIERLSLLGRAQEQTTQAQEEMQRTQEAMQEAQVETQRTQEEMQRTQEAMQEAQVETQRTLEEMQRAQAQAQERISAQLAELLRRLPDPDAL